MTISLPDTVKEFIEARAAEQGYADPREYVLALIEKDERRKLKKELEDKLLAGLAEPGVPMTPQDWEDIRREAMGRIRERESQ